MGRKRKASNLKEPVDLPADEQLRRRKQRELQKIALALRAEGQQYQKRRAPQPARAADDVERAKLKTVPHKHNVTPAPFEVIVLPIFWNQNPKEKKLVLDRAQQVATHLEAAGVRHMVDTTNKFTPGQRMRHWEEGGVKVRIEIGPKDAESFACIIARSQPTPGRVAYKEAAAIDPAMAQRAVELIQMPDAEVPEGDELKYRKKRDGAKAGDEDVLDAAGLGSMEQETRDGCGGGGAATAERATPTGDDLEDDFVGVLEDSDNGAIEGAGKPLKNMKARSRQGNWDTKGKRKKRKGD